MIDSHVANQTDKRLATRQIQRLATGIAPVDLRLRLPELAGPGSTPLLTAKLSIPLPHGALLPRPRLTAQLRQGLEQTMTLIVAPAGYGKTTLLSEWARQQAQTVAWLSLDAGDNDPVQFWSYVAAALDRLCPGLGDQALALLRPTGAQTQALATEAALTVLINGLMAAPGDIALVLDDYHRINAEAIHRGLAFLADHLPPMLHLFVASRSDPPLPLARLRASDALSELHAADLRFTYDEIDALLNQAMRLKLPSEAIAALEARTEGWVAGLRLAAHAIQRCDDVPDFMQDLLCNNRDIEDYLIEEVLQQQSAAIQAFLLDSAVLDRMSAPLCDAVLGRTENQEPGTEAPSDGSRSGTLWVVLDSQAMLEHLEHANLFIIPLDAERRWYRYHHLFAEFLRARLQQRHPERISELHSRAATWYERNGLADEAAQHRQAARAAEQQMAPAKHPASGLLHDDARDQRTLLSARELDVLQLLASGMSNQAIADTLIIGANTVKMHLKHIYAKLDVHNRVQAITHARALGLLLQ